MGLVQRVNSGFVVLTARRTAEILPQTLQGRRGIHAAGLDEGKGWR